MSSRTREINRITMAIIRISVKLMLLALLILLLYEAVIQGYAFGHAVFYAEAMEDAPGHDITVVVKDGENVSQAADELEKKGLIKNIYAFLFQSRFYDYNKIYPGTYTLNTSMTSKDILQKLSEKPETDEEDKTNTSGTDAKKHQSELQAEEANAADAAKSTLSAGEAQADEYSYSGEDEEEGGWIEDVTEDGQMIVDNRITEYLHSLENSRGDLLDGIEKKAIEDGVPIIRSETAALLRSLTAALQPANILEIGTAVGYSALQMCQVMPANCHITTIEKYEKRIPEAKENFKKAGEESRITFLEGDADFWLRELKGKKFDLVFMDAAKGQYLNWLPLLLDLMPVGSVLISDNVLQDGDVVQSRFAVQRRNRTIHSRMREYLYELKHMEEFETAVIPIGDGVTISTRIR